jgi:5,10-methylenetetrahydromethanopterin reductase
LHWVTPASTKVPVEVAATGVRVLGVAARTADRVMLALGADPERVRWGIDTVRAARSAADHAPDGVAVGAFVNVVAHPDLDIARTLVSGGLSTFARFSVMHGTPTGPVDDTQREVLGKVRGAYDMTRHTQVGSPQATALTPAFIDRFAIVGDSNLCVRRLRELVELGLDKLIVTGPTLGADRTEARSATERFAAEVLPALRS